jgi:TonB family protein
VNIALAVTIQSTVILAFAFLSAALLRRASAAMRHYVWVLGVTAALLAPAIASLSPKLEFPRNTLLAGKLFRPQLQQADPAILVWQSFPEKPKRFRFEYVAWTLWILGALCVSARFVLAARGVQRLLKGASPVSDASHLVDHLREDLLLRQPVALALSDRQISPMTWGIFRHVIILPSDWFLWTESRQRAILTHELAHVKRRDGLIQVFAQAACCLYWFNPLAWYAAHRIWVEREYACDDQVLTAGELSETYATHLLDVARSLASAAEFSIAPQSVGEGSLLEKRLVAILDGKTNRRSFSRVTRNALFCSITAIAVILGAAWPGLIASFQTRPQIVGSSLEVVGHQADRVPFTAPQLSSFTLPSYTPEAFGRRVEGTISLATRLDSQGDVTEVRVVNGLGYGLDESASNAVQSWKFTPALINGAPRGASMQLAVEFKLARAGIPLAAGITPPKIISRVEPRLTREASAVGANGTVVLEVVVQPDGKAEMARVIQPLGYGLTESAIDALSRWVFQPGTKAGEALPIRMNLSLIFDVH